MSKTVKSIVAGVLVIVISSGIVGMIGWMRSVDKNTYRTAEILERMEDADAEIKKDFDEMKEDLKLFTGIVIKNSENLKEHGRMIESHQRQIETIKRSD